MSGDNDEVTAMRKPMTRGDGDWFVLVAFWFMIVLTTALA
jgi:hypothetical protein